MANQPFGERRHSDFQFRRYVGTRLRIIPSDHVQFRPRLLNGSAWLQPAKNASLNNTCLCARHLPPLIKRIRYPDVNLSPYPLLREESESWRHHTYHLPAFSSKRKRLTDD